MEEKTQNIHISSILYKEVHKNLNLAPFLRNISDKLSIEEFGNGIKRFLFVFIIMPPSNRIHQPYTRYYKKTKNLDVYARMDYVTFLNHTPETALPYMAWFLIEELKKLESKEIPDFDMVAFRKEVEQRLNKAGILSPVNGPS